MILLPPSSEVVAATEEWEGCRYFEDTSLSLEVKVGTDNLGG